MQKRLGMQLVKRWFQPNGGTQHKGISFNQKGNEFTAHSKPIQAITDAIEMAVSIFFSYPIYLTENQQMVSIPITSTGGKKKKGIADTITEQIKTYLSLQNEQLPCDLAAS